MKKVLEIPAAYSKDAPADYIADLWNRYNSQRQVKVQEWLELRNYVFATDTSTTSNASLPWKNSTTLPKLCQIRDNLHSNYLSALFPNDNWLQWVGYSQEDSVKKKAKSIEGYINNKTREGHFRTEMSKGLYDFIDYGNAFFTTDFENDTREIDGETVTSFIGPRAYRISPLDIVFNPLANSFADTFKIVRSLKTIGELKGLAKTYPDQSYWSDVLERREGLRSYMAGLSYEDYNRLEGYTMDGFGSYQEYLTSEYVEILTFYGDIHDSETGELMTNQKVVITDRSFVAYQDDIPSWFGQAPIYHVGWRFRPDNLWAMGPLDNLVGMQYRIDHLENLKADAMDLVVHPPLKIKGDVDEFTWGPNAQIFMDENGDVQELGQNLNGIITAQNEIQQLEDRMEAFAGAPRQAMGIRTPGEKTAFEVQQLQNAAGRIFQEKITNYEIELLEPLLNAMLETSRRNMNGADVIKVTDSETGLAVFQNITKEDITSRGVLRPVGARHFAQQAQDIQNLSQTLNGPLGQLIMPHTSGKQLAKFIENSFSLEAWGIFSPNIAIDEQQETQAQMNQAQEDNEVAASGPTEDF